MNRFEKAAEFGARFGKAAGVGSMLVHGVGRGSRLASRESPNVQFSGEHKSPTGLLLGLGLGGLSGALYGALNPRKDEQYELDEKGNIKIDDKGLPKTYLKNRSRLMESLRRASTGAIIGGGLGLAGDIAFGPYSNYHTDSGSARDLQQKFNNMSKERQDALIEAILKQNSR